MQNQLAPIQQQPSVIAGPPSWLPSVQRWLEKWAQDIPTTGGQKLTAEEQATVSTWIPKLETSLTSDIKAFAVGMDRLIQFAQTFGLPAADLKSSVEFYKAALSDLPPDLMMEAIDMTIKTHKYHVLPKPAEIRKHVEDKLTRRRRLLHLAQRAAMRK